MKRHVLLVLLTLCCCLQHAASIAATRQDTLRGSNGAGRRWWDVTHYALTVTLDTASEVITGNNRIRFKIIAPPGDSLQLDLQDTLSLDSVLYAGTKLDVAREDNVWWVTYPFHQWQAGSVQELTAYYHGRPRTAKNPPWDGGMIRKRDSTGNLWMAVACQGLGASSWWPCKDIQSDEPDSGMTIRIVTNSRFPAVANGRLLAKPAPEDTAAYRAWVWQVSNPINNYDVSFYIGDYIHWTDTLMGAKGRLDLAFYALRANEDKARRQFAVVKPMLHCFEYWMGAYPFYEDGYKLVEAPYPGMEHQSAVAYGNGYKMGYNGADRSGTGIGLSFDFIIVHESGHEWFGNSITAADIADNWLHEGFTTYAEALFAECLLGREQAFAYTRGEWKHIRNDRPVTGRYGVQDAGSGDKYDKGAALVHTIRLLLDDDAQFRRLLHALQDTFYHKTVTSREVEDFISRFTGRDFTPVFNQYLRLADIPELTYFIKEKNLFYRFTGAVPGLRLPVMVSSGEKSYMLRPAAEWQSIRWQGGYDVSFSSPFLIRLP